MINKLIETRYAHFALGGFLLFLFELGSTFFMKEYLGMSVMLAYAIALAVGLLLLFYYHLMITFGVKKQKYMRRKFFFLYLISYVVNWNLVTALVYLGFNYLLSITAVSAILSLADFLISKRWVFKNA